MSVPALASGARALARIPVLFSTDYRCKLLTDLTLPEDFTRKVQKLTVLQPTREVIRMDQRSFSLLAGVIFTIIALLHLLRIIYGWDPVVEGWRVPKWISWVALIVSGYLGYEGLRLAIKSRRS